MTPSSMTSLWLSYHKFITLWLSYIVSDAEPIQHHITEFPAQGNFLVASEPKQFSAKTYASKLTNCWVSS